MHGRTSQFLTTQMPSRHRPTLKRLARIVVACSYSDIQQVQSLCSDLPQEAGCATYRLHQLSNSTKDLDIVKGAEGELGLIKNIAARAFEHLVAVENNEIDRRAMHATPENVAMVYAQADKERAKLQAMVDRVKFILNQ